ncbi:ankyrin repeat domain-containing protein [Chryseosolibacter indicus]|uniref:Ankyrin repeat domain-containing protein n=1 Tax=Chryseosolibacter indicus TaxID=2782351 RepID=A0ABS5VWP9_9BACT|nr:ankyrin repeat domain-containing protein [Chryseosolibacter indicus]MBT1705852.1 ankyrin repeat domain-containing protein [Chryseosolibacter indicus]
MKTHNSNALTVFIKTYCLITLLLVASCKTKEDGKQNSSHSGLKAPDVDIHTAVVTGNIDALKQHIAAGSNLNEKDPYGGSSPLISACVFGKTDEAKVLIDAGADLNFQNNDGSTPLHTAAFFCRPEIVKMLLDKGADKTIKNKFGATAYESVSGSFNEAKNAYDMMGKILGPMGLKLDYDYIQKTRPVIADMLK